MPVDAVNTSRRICRSGHVFSRSVRHHVSTIFRCSEAISEGQREGFRVPLAPQRNSSSEALFESYVGGDVTDDETSMVVVSIHAQTNRAGNIYRVLWRQGGRQRSLTFENLPAAERFKKHCSRTTGLTRRCESSNSMRSVATYRR